MADEDTTGNPPADGEDSTGSESERDSSTREGEEGTGHSSDQDSDSESVTDLKAKLSAANREAAKFRKERNTAQAELKKRQDAELSDSEREKKRADEAEAKLTASMERIQDANLQLALAKHGSIVDPETASLLLRNRGIDFDDDGKPQNIDEAIKSLVEDKPFLAGKQRSRTSSGDTNGGAGSSEGEEGAVHLTADELEMARAFKMSPEDYAKAKDKDYRPTVKGK